MSKQKVLIQIDCDSQASTFDSIVAIDAGVDRLLSRTAVSAFDVQSLVHGAMFTRGGDDLKRTALFFGGSDVEQAESLVKAAKKCFFGPVRVSLMSDPNGSNTTSAAAVLSACQHLDLNGKTVTVLAATGPVGQRISQLCYARGAEVRVCSRSKERAESVCKALIKAMSTTAKQEHVGKFVPTEVINSNVAVEFVDGVDVVFAAGAAGIELLDDKWVELANKPKVVVDVNAVPPTGISGVDVMDKANDRDGVISYGAIGVGGMKMKIHRRCIQRLYDANDLSLELNEIFEIGQEMFEKTK